MSYDKSLLRFAKTYTQHHNAKLSEARTYNSYSITIRQQVIIRFNLKSISYNLGKEEPAIRGCDSVNRLYSSTNGRIQRLITHLKAQCKFGMKPINARIVVTQLVSRRTCTGFFE